VWVGDPGAAGREVKEMRRVVISDRYYSQVYGGTLPAQIFRSTMRRAHEDLPEERFERPDRSATDGQDVAVPDVAGLPLDVAEETLVAAGFSVRDGGRVAAFPIKRGAAAYTSPKAGREVVFGTTVTLYESSGRQRRAPARRSAPEAPSAPLPGPVAPAEEQTTAQSGKGNGNGRGNGRGGNG
jgi:membrane peptidoglycan carboxypeptidase